MSYTLAYINSIGEGLKSMWIRFESSMVEGEPHWLKGVLVFGSIYFAFAAGMLAMAGWF